MSKNSEAVKEWRKNTKLRMIESLGSECCICGYKKCTSALEFHHLDPGAKETGLGAARSSPVKWTSIVVELRKCVLVCSNCHREVHDGLAQVPSNPTRFNEEYAEYRIVGKTEPCPVCGKEKPLHQVTCSRECIGKRGRIVDWSKINLESELSIKTYSEIGRELGISSNAVSKRAKKLGLRSPEVNKTKVDGNSNKDEFSEVVRIRPEKENE